MIRRRVPAGHHERLAELYGDGDRTKHFDALDRHAQAAAIRQLARDGLGDYEIAHATQLAVEQVRETLAAGARTDLSPSGGMSQPEAPIEEPQS